MIELDAVRRRYREFADTECRGYSDLYYRLSLDAAADDSVMRFIADRPVIQPNLFLAAVQYVTGADRMPSTVSDLRALLDERGADIAEIMATRRTQTNEVGRCSVLLPALPSGPLALVGGRCERGPVPSARPVLLRLRVGSHRSPFIASPTSLCTDVRTAAAVNCRRSYGVEASISRQSMCATMKQSDGCSHVSGRIIRIAGNAWRQRFPSRAPTLRRSCAATWSMIWLVCWPKRRTDASLVVFHSAVLCYVSPQRSKAFENVLADASRNREIVWVSNEPSGVVPTLRASPAADAQMQFLLARKTLTRRVATSELLALVHPHGSEMTWLA